MGTRSIIAIPDGDAWKGRYVHWDGYPTARGAGVWALVQTHGLETVIDTLVLKHHGWSTVQPGYEPRVDDPFRPSDRFIQLPGWGEAYTPEEQPDEWCTPTDTWGTEWFYVLAPGGLVVGKVSGDAATTPIGFFPWTGPEPGWEALTEEGYALLTL